jgi:hypothetical protein
MIVAAMIGATAESIRTRLTHHLLSIATVVGWILVAWVIAASYVGHSFSPYGTCYNASGRGIQCLAGRR